MRNELIGGGDELADWARACGLEFFIAPDGADLAGLATASHWVAGGGFDPGAVNQFLQVADYYLVAQAHARSFVVVTHEVAANSLRKIKIPNACVGLGAKFMSPYEMLRTERARFVLGA